MKYGYFPGCSLQSTSKEYDASLRAICEKLDIELEEIENWICCGSSAIHIAPRRLAVALPAQNLANAQEQGLSEVVAPCAACFARFKSAQNELELHPDLLSEMEGIIGKPVSNNVKVLHPLELFSDGLLKHMGVLANQALAGLKVVCYYCCLLTRPPKVTHFDDVENPQTMDRVMSVLGASVMKWDHKTDCCGGFFALVKPEIVYQLSHEILEDARRAGAQAIVVACPLCQVNLDTRQAEINQVYQTDFNLPILYFTQLIGVALGIPQSKLGLKSHFVSPMELIKEKAGQV